MIWDRAVLRGALLTEAGLAEQGEKDVKEAKLQKHDVKLDSAFLGCDIDVARHASSTYI